MRFRGEYLNGIIMSAYLEMPFIDAAEVIFFDENGNFDDARTDMQLKKRLSQESTAVIPGITVQNQMELSKHFPEEVLTLPDRLWQRRSMQICMKTGQMYLDLW